MQATCGGRGHPMPRLKMLFFIVLNLGASLKASERQHPASTDSRRLFPRFSQTSLGLINVHLFILRWFFKHPVW